MIDTENRAKKKGDHGFSLIEAMIAIGILGFITMSVLNAFFYQKLFSKITSQKNIAISLSESKMEDLFKFPGGDIQTNAMNGDNPQVEFFEIVNNGVKDLASETDSPNCIKRTTELIQKGDFMDISVMVEYGKKEGKYPFKVKMGATRWE